MNNTELLLRLRELGATIDRQDFREKDNGKLLSTKYTVRNCVFTVQVEPEVKPKAKK